MDGSSLQHLHKGCRSMHSSWKQPRRQCRDVQNNFWKTQTYRNTSIHIGEVDPLPPFLASIECTSQSTSHKQTLSICFELVAMGMELPTLFLHVFFSKTLRMSLRIVCWFPFVLWDGPWQLWAWRPHWASMADQRIL